MWTRIWRIPKKHAIYEYFSGMREYETFYETWTNLDILNYDLIDRLTVYVNIFGKDIAIWYCIGIIRNERMYRHNAHFRNVHPTTDNI